jgi:hypothetical protein
MKKTLLSYLLIGFLCIHLFSCNKESIELVDSKEFNSEIKVKDGYLVFSNYNVFEKTRKQLVGYNRTQLDDWESKFSTFTSQRYIFEKAIDDQEAYLSHLEDLVKSEKVSLESVLNNYNIFSPYVEENREVFTFDDHVFGLTIANYDRNIEYFVGKNGLIQIGDTVYQYSGNYKRATHKDNQKEISVLKHYTTNSTDDKVIVTEIQKYRMPISSGSIATEDFSLGDNQGAYCTGISGDRRIDGMAEYYLAIVNDPSRGGPQSMVHLYLKVNHFSKNIWGKWSSSRSKTLHIKGTVNYHVGAYVAYNLAVDVHSLNNNLYTSSMIVDILYTNWVLDTWYWSPAMFWSTGKVSYYGPNGTECDI